MRFSRYLLGFSIPAVAFYSLEFEGVAAYIPMLYAFGMIPTLELLFKGSKVNLNPEEEREVGADRAYDFLLYLCVPIQFGFLLYGLLDLNIHQYDWLTWAGRISSMGLMCGVIGINVGHELGHRQRAYEKVFAKLLLSSSLYVHFFTEHNYGHHRNVATEEDPATARYNENLYRFWIRSLFGSYSHAWSIQKQLLKQAKANFWSPKNNLLLWHGFQILLLLTVGLAFGWEGLGAFGLAALFGALLLETVNYIEHYGLLRNKVNERRYENTQVHHSWNSNHFLGRLVLFELSRHSDHHANPHRKYQILAHHDESPQLPTGYPGMMLLSLVPPLWFWVMNRRV